MTYHDWAHERALMVRTQIRDRGVASPRVLEAMNRVPRERFLPEPLRPRAYADHALSIGHHQTISQPYMVAAMTAALDLQGTENVLEIGTGSGYQTAVLGELAAHVWSVERIPELAHTATALLNELGYGNVRVRTGDGTLGWPEEAPFDAILVTAGAPAPPPTLLRQLSDEGGILVAPVGDRDLQQVVAIRRRGADFSTTTLMGCRFVLLLGEEGWSA
ncbi:MAG TPA: protein-L-isoaspartate(D-aspartate) O-methyltransferase [Longimicrobiales bacterium]|nr:protein-L-isoaspartate(D-aspartate) O-methyltransferase [Longimicrobiales bacterium]